MSSISVRKIGVSEIDRFYDLLVECVRTVYPEYSEKMQNYFLQRPQSYTRENVRYWLANGTAYGFLGYIDDILAGFLYGRKPDTGVAFLSWIGVLPKFQKKGLGKALIKAWEKQVLTEGAHVIHLYTFALDLPFYEKCGYKPIALDEKSWFGIDHYIVRKHLQEPKEENYLK